MAKKSYYSRKLLWKWVLIYLAIGAVVYFLIYYFVIARRNPATYTAPNSTSPTYKLPGY